MRLRADEGFQGETKQELSFNKGDIIITLDSEERLQPGWLKGLCNGLFKKKF